MEEQGKEVVNQSEKENLMALLVRAISSQYTIQTQQYVNDEETSQTLFPL